MMNAPSIPIVPIATAASNGPSTMAAWTAPASSALAWTSWSSGTRRGGSARNAGSENAPVAPCSAASATSTGNEPAKRNATDTPADSKWATMITRLGPHRSMGMPASGARIRGGSDQASPSSTIAPGPASKRKTAKPQSATIAPAGQSRSGLRPLTRSASRRSRKELHPVQGNDRTGPIRPKFRGVGPRSHAGTGPSRRTMTA